MLLVRKTSYQQEFCAGIEDMLKRWKLSEMTTGILKQGKVFLGFLKKKWAILYSYLCGHGLYGFYSITKYNIAGINIR